MKQDDDIPNACGLFVIPLNFGQFTLRPFSSLDSNKMSPEELDHYECLIEGIAHMISENAQFLVSLGELLIDRHQSEIEFEADDELIAAINESKVIPFNKKS